MLAISLATAVTCWVGWRVFFVGAVRGSVLTNGLFALFDSVSERSGQWLVWGFVLSVAVPIMLAYLARVRRQVSAWRRLAARTGPEFKPSGCLSTTGPRIVGTYRGRQVDLYRYSPSIDDVLDEMCIRLQVNNPGGGYLRLDHAPIGRAIGVLLWPQKQTRTGDEVFDRQFSITSRPEAFAAAVLASSDLRQRLLHVRESTTIELRGEQLSLERAGLEGDEAYLHFLFDLLCELAGAAESARRVL
jgi:hypothetical protein